MIRPAVEAALGVARQGLQAEPPQTPPAGVRRYLGFSRLSAPALKVIARTVEQDEGFRRRVAAAVGESDVGRAGWLWLTRPAGWADEIERLEAEARRSAAVAAEERGERDARRRLVAAQDAATKATALARDREREAAKLRASLADERSRRLAAEAQAEELAAAVEEARSERSKAVRELKEAEARVAARAAEARRAKERVRELEARGDSPAGGSGRAGAPASMAAVAEVLREAASGATAVGEQLTQLSEALSRVADEGAELAGRASPAEPVAPESPTPGAAGPPPEAGGQDAPVGLVRRMPVRLPGGVLDDSTEAAEHLLRVPNAVVLVDGYNVSMSGWPDLPVASQRARLLDGLDRAAARYAASLEVVFDGADVEQLHVGQLGSRDVGVRFSPAGVEADDVLLAMLGQVSPVRPVVVVSSDNRVREGARRQGANVVHARQLLALMDP